MASIPWVYFQDSASTTGFTLAPLGSVADGATVFTELDDVPATYSGQGSKSVRVNSAANGLEFFTPDFLQLPDTPNSFSGQGGKYVTVNPGGTALVFSNLQDDPVLPVQIVGDTGVMGSDVGSVTFSPIPATHNHLRIRSMIRCSGADITLLAARINGDTTAANYISQSLSSTDTTVAGDSSVVTQGMWIGLANGTDAGTTNYGVSDALISFYTDAGAKRCTSLAAGFVPTVSYGITIMSEWKNVNAVDSITIVPAGGLTIKAGSRIILYAEL